MRSVFNSVRRFVCPVETRDESGRIFDSSAPSRVEISLLWLFTAFLFTVVLTRFRTYAGTVDTFGDSMAYMNAANAIRHWDFSGLDVKQFWGLPYLIACVSWVHVSTRSSLLLICILSSLVSVLLAWHLWGPWIAGFFAVLNFPWLQVSFLGGSEPLFVALLFASFRASRKEHWIEASILAALATTVRPLGFFALLGIGIALLLRSQYEKALACTSLAVIIGVLYLLPFWIYFHDPLYQVHLYRQYDWGSGSPIGWPFRGMLWFLLHHLRIPLTNVIFTLGWIFFALTGLCAMSGKNYREYIRGHSSECIFAILYLNFLFLYNSGWAYGEFPRFVIPVIPFLLRALDAWLPKLRYVMYMVGALSSVLGAFSAIGIRNVFVGLR